MSGEPGAARHQAPKVGGLHRTQTTAERANAVVDRGIYRALLEEAWSRGEGKEVRLIGAGVRFADPVSEDQMSLGLD